MSRVWLEIERKRERELDNNSFSASPKVNPLNVINHGPYCARYCFRERK